MPGRRGIGCGSMPGRRPPYPPKNTKVRTQAMNMPHMTHIPTWPCALPAHSHNADNMSLYMLFLLLCCCSCVLRFCLMGCCDVVLVSHVDFVAANVVMLWCCYGVVLAVVDVVLDVVIVGYEVGVCSFVSYVEAHILKHVLAVVCEYCDWCWLWTQVNTNLLCVRS